MPYFYIKKTSENVLFPEVFIRMKSRGELVNNDFADPPIKSLGYFHITKLVFPAGVEPATLSFIARRSNPLSYGSIFILFAQADGLEPLIFGFGDRRSSS